MCIALLSSLSLLLGFQLPISFSPSSPSPFSALPLLVLYSPLQILFPSHRLSNLFIWPYFLQLTQTPTPTTQPSIGSKLSESAYGAFISNLENYPHHIYSSDLLSFFSLSRPNVVATTNPRFSPSIGPRDRFHGRITLHFIVADKTTATQKLRKPTPSVTLEPNDKHRNFFIQKHPSWEITRDTFCYGDNSYFEIPLVLDYVLRVLIGPVNH